MRTAKKILVLLVLIFILAPTVYAQKTGISEEQATTISMEQMRDLEAFSFLLATYINKGNGPPAEMLANVPRKNIIFCHANNCNLSLEENEENKTWLEFFSKQKVKEGAGGISRDNILILLTDSDLSVLETEVIEPNDSPGSKKIAIWFSRGFYSYELVKAPEIDSIRGRDFLDDWRSKNNGNERTRIELLGRLVVMTGEFAHLNFLLRDEFTSRIANCVKGEVSQDSKDNESCSDMLWNYELESAEAIYDMSEQIKKGAVMPEIKSKKIKTGGLMPEIINQFFYGGQRKKTGLRNYLRFILPKYYPKKADLFKPFWDKK